MDIAIAPDLAGRIRLGVAVIEGVTVRDGDPALAAEIAQAGEEIRGLNARRSSGEVPGVEEARALYKAVGIDPTKTRPSNEALLRRVLKGEALPSVNTLVDALNLSSLREQVPFGLYDLDKIKPPVTLRRGMPLESYPGIRKAVVHIADRPVLADAHGPFGNPTSDSARTSITAETRSALVVAYAPAGCPTARLQAVLERTAATLIRHAGGAATVLRA